MKAVFIFLLGTFINATGWAAYSVYHTATGQTVTAQSWIEQLTPRGYIVLGETHYNANIQRTQAQVIQDVVTFHQLDSDFQLGMELLNHPQQVAVDQIMAKYKAGVTADDELLLDPVFDSMGPASNRDVYLPLFQAVKSLHGELLALNAPRPWRQVIVKQGLDALAPEQTVPNMWVGGPEYYELFVAALGGHGGGTVDKYFEAQSYVDSVISYKAEQNHRLSLQFIVIGHFHTQYGFGLVERLKKLTSHPLVNAEVIDASILTPEEIVSLKQGHPRFGARADVLIFAH